MTVKELIDEHNALKAEMAAVMDGVGKLVQIIEPLLPSDGKKPGMTSIVAIATRLMNAENQKKLGEAIFPIVEIHKKYETKNGKR